MPNILKNVKKTFANMRSENWGGIAGIAAGLVVLFAGDIQSYAATVMSLAANGIFSRWGHKSWGYSLACALISIVNFVLCFSIATAGNSHLQFVMFMLAVAWAVGALRYPLEIISIKLADHTPKASRRLQGLAGRIPPCLSVVLLVLRVPTLVTAAVGGSYIMFAAHILWGTCDVLVGRVPERLRDVVNYLMKTMRDGGRKQKGQE